MKRKIPFQIIISWFFFSGLVDCLNDEDCLGAERKCFRNITLHEGKCVCNEGYKQAKEDPIKCLSIGMNFQRFYNFLMHVFDFNLHLLVNYLCIQFRNSYSKQNRLWLLPSCSGNYHSIESMYLANGRCLISIFMIIIFFYFFCIYVDLFFDWLYIFMLSNKSLFSSKNFFLYLIFDSFFHRN